MSTSPTVMNSKINTVNTQQSPKKGDKPEEMAAGFDSLFASMFSQADRPLNTVQNQFQQGLLQTANERRPAQVPVLNNVANAVHNAIASQKSGSTANQSPAPANSETQTSPSSSTSSQPANGNQSATANSTATSDAQSTEASPSTQADAQAGQTAVAQSAGDNAAVQTPQTSASEALETNGSKQPNALGQLTAEPTQNEANAKAPVDPKAVAEGNKSLLAETASKPNGTEPAAQSSAQSSKGTSAENKAEAFLKNAEHRVHTETDVRTSPSDRLAARGSEAAVRGEINSQIAQTRADLTAQATQAASNRTQAGLQAGERKLATTDLAAAGKAGGPTGLGAVQVQQPLGTGLAREASIKTPVNQPGFAQELGQKVNWAIGKNLSTVDIKLNPEQFGAMSLRIVQKGQNIQLMIRTTDDSAASMLNQATGALKEVLAQSGLQLNQVQISSSAQSPQSFTQNFGSQQGQDSGSAQNGQQGQSGNQQQGRNPQGGQESNLRDASATDRPSRKLPNSDGLDLFA